MNLEKGKIMNNTINGYSNISFGSRYLQVKQPNAFPKNVYNAIYKSDGIEEFLNAGKPKTLWGKFKALFQKNEILEVYYGKGKMSEHNFRAQKEQQEKISEYDPYALKEWVNFIFKKGDTRKFFNIEEFQTGIRRKAGSIPKPGENHTFKKPLVTAEDKLVKSIEDIKDLETLLK